MNDKTKERIEEARRTLESGIADLLSSERWEEYLLAQSHFHNYSFRNVLWLMAQAQDRGISPTRFAGFTTWQELDRHVKQGEKAFWVLAPCMYKRRDDKTGEDTWSLRGFKASPVFELSQTEGKDLPSVAQKLSGTSSEVESLIGRLADFAQTLNVRVTRTDPGSGANGYFCAKDKEIVVSDKIDDMQAAKTLCHEIAHAMLHADMDQTRQVAEVEAESVAFVVLHALGFAAGQYSFGYIATWSRNDPKIVADVASRVQRAAKQIIDALSATTEEAQRAA